jgi:hypothetical protein
LVYTRLNSFLLASLLMKNTEKECPMVSRNRTTPFLEPNGHDVIYQQKWLIARKI